MCVPELDFEIPPSTNEGSITTIESILLKAAVGLEKEQPVRKVCILLLANASFPGPLSAHNSVYDL